MVNKQKQKGSRWEADAVILLNRYLDGTFKRIPGSGAIGTLLGESILTGDINGRVHGFSKGFKIEAKCGYGEKEMTIKKDWLDKIKTEAEATYSFPMLMGKFSGARSGVKHFVIFDFETFTEVFNYVSNLKRELDSIYEKLAKETK